MEMDDNKRSSEKLNKLLESCIDAEKTFSQAAKEVKNKALKEYFFMQATKRSKFATELTTEILGLGGTPTETGSTAEGLHRTWAGLKSAISKNDEKAALEECRRIDQASLEEYKKVAALQDVKTASRNMLDNQRKSIEADLNKIKNLSDLETEFGK